MDADEGADPTGEVAEGGGVVEEVPLLNLKDEISDCGMRKDQKNKRKTERRMRLLLN